MKIAIGLPATIPGVSGATILDWARRAETRSYSSLGVIDRLVYPNYESMIALAAAAGATQRIRLMTTVLIAPLRNTGVLAKEAASLDALSGGRLTLGLGVGARKDDFLAATASFADRGRRFEQQITEMRRIWSGQPVSADVGPIGPPPVQVGGPEILVGGYSPIALRRAGRLADGFIAGGGPPEQAQAAHGVVEEAWRNLGRAGKPRFVTATYFGLGPNAADRAADYIRSYYAFLGPAVEGFAQSIPSTPEMVKGTIQAFADVGADELVLWPCIPDLDQVDRLADLLPAGGNW